MDTTQQTSPLKAIKMMCRDQCCNNDMDSWKNCPIESCQLHPFRMGKNPFRKKREFTAEEKQAIADRLEKSRENK